MVGHVQPMESTMDRLELLKQMPMNLELDHTDTIKCSRCDERTHEAEVQQVGAWWVCGICYDDL